MTDSVAVLVEGERDIELRFEEFPQRLHALLVERITALTELMEARVRAAIPRRTRKSASEIAMAVFDKPERIEGAVYFVAEWAKIGALEYGAHRPFTMKEHAARLDHVFARRLAAPLTVLVRAHRRTPNIREYRFLRGADPESTLAGIAAELQGAVNDALGDDAP